MPREGDLCDECIASAGEGRLEGVCGRWKVGRSGVARHIDVVACVDRDPGPGVGVAATEVCRVEESRSGTIQLRHKSIEQAAAESRLSCARRRWEVAGQGPASDVSLTTGVHCDAIAVVIVAAAEIGGVDER